MTVGDTAKLLMTPNQSLKPTDYRAAIWALRWAR